MRYLGGVRIGHLMLSHNGDRGAGGTNHLGFELRIMTVMFSA
jgi:hypothetical protein